MVAVTEQEQVQGEVLMLRVTAANSTAQEYGKRLAQLRLRRHKKCNALLLAGD